MIDLTTETPIALTEVPGLLPPGRQGRPVHISAIHRWVMDGSVAPDGQRVRLEAVRVGGRWITSKEALQRFAEALTPRLDNSPAPSMRTTAQRTRASAKAATALEAAGV